MTGPCKTGFLVGLTLCVLCMGAWMASGADKPKAPAKPAAKPPAAKPANPPAEAAPSGRVSPDAVDAAVAKAVAFLYSQQKNGTWETVAAPKGNGQADVAGAQWGGLTAIATYALLAAGESPQDDKLAPAIKFLQDANIVGMYALGLRANVWAEMPLTAIVKQCAKRDAQLLYNAMKTEGGVAGLYNYTADGKGGRADHSVSQYGVLGMWACVATGEVEPVQDYWQTVENAWSRDQHTDGGWGYDPGNAKAPTASMTAAGIATLFLTQDYCHGDLGVGCTGNMQNRRIDGGVKWIADHFAEVKDLYTWYGIERIGVASGHKYLGPIDWYQKGAAHLLASQGGNGAWSGAHGGPIGSTAFGILFLVRGRAPVMINKLEYDLQQPGGARPKTANWNQRPRDVANLVRWTGRQTERFLNWQIVNLNSPLVDLLEAPILYLSGDAQGLSFSPQEEAKLKQYLEQGGLIVGNADCGTSAANFSKAFEALGQKLFKIYEFRTLQKDHLLYRNHYSGAKWREFEVRSLNNGAREMMVLFRKDDPAKFWQTRQVGGKEAYHQFMANLFLYTTEKQNPRTKGSTYLIHADDSQPTRAIKVARLQYASSAAWDPEPGGWRRLAAYMHNVEKVDLQVSPVVPGKGQLSGYKVAHLTGTTTFRLHDAERTEIVNFVKNGGTLILDACGGNADFVASANNELPKLFGNDANQLLDPLKPSHAAYQAGSVKIESCGYRMFAQRKLLENLHIPRIRGLEINGRAAVFFSEEDLSEGLVGQSVDGILGYQPSATKDDSGRLNAGATEIMASLIMYADSAGGGASAPAPKPATPAKPPAKKGGK